MTIAGLTLFAIGAFLSLANFYLSFVRYFVHRALGGSKESYRFVSGIPLFGSLLLWASIPLLPSTTLMWLAAALSLCDTAGIHWFIGVLWWHGEWPFTRCRMDPAAEAATDSSPRWSAATSKPRQRRQTWFAYNVHDVPEGIR